MRQPIPLTSCSERIAELGTILAAGHMRLRARQSSHLSPDTGENSLHFSVAESGPDTRINPRKGRGRAGDER